jgi:L-iditol 2-dehydrogenase
MGALLEPLSVAIHATRRAQITKQSSVLVMGAGAIGLLCAAMSKDTGSEHVTIADIQPDRVTFATGRAFADFGVTIPLKKGHNVEEKLKIAQETATLACRRLETEVGSKYAFDVVFECTGAEACTQAAIFVSPEQCALWTLI